MSSLSPKIRSVALAVIFVTGCFAQDAATTPAKQPLEHVLGTIDAIDASAHTVTVKEDKTNAERVIHVANTKTLLKVEPNAKDLKAATRISADDLQAGDRVDVRGSKTDETSGALDARIVILMSARDLQQVHQAQAAAWQHSTVGTVSSVDPAAGKITIAVKGAEGVKPVVISTAKTTEFTRYSTENPKVPAPSDVAQIQPGDQVRVLGDKSEDGRTVTAQKVYSGAFRNISATITSIAPDGKAVTVKDLATKKEVIIAVSDDTTMRKLPPMMAYMLARRFNPNFKMPEAGAGAGGVGGQGGQARSTVAGAQGPVTGSPDAMQRPAGGYGGGYGGAGGSAPSGPGAGGAGMHGGGGDVAQTLERAPKIALADLKAGDAVVIFGVAVGSDSSHLVASNIIAGVEPILQSAPARQGGSSLGGDWGMGEMSAPQ
jgi:Cu/Ag efflux protein CusF